MITRLIGIATLFAAGSILVAGTPTLGARDLNNQAGASTSFQRCGGHHRCGGGRRCATRQCATRQCSTRWCATRTCASRTCGHSES